MSLRALEEAGITLTIGGGLAQLMEDAHQVIRLTLNSGEVNHPWRTTPHLAVYKILMTHFKCLPMLLHKTLNPIQLEVFLMANRQLI